MPPCKKRFWRGIACALILVLQSGCARVSGGEYCLLYLPVYASTKDTEETRRQIDMNNVVWQELCAN